MRNYHKKIPIPGGTALIGTKRGVIKADGESPSRKVKLKRFALDNTAVSNERFAAFVDATGFQTDAERLGWSYVFYYHLPTSDRDDTLGVSDDDAKAFAKWAKGRLPTEAEWEHAARGGQDDVMFPWGDQEPDESDFLPCNIWQGQFPNHNPAADGYTATAPVDAFAPNAYGLHNMVGNAWEWTAVPYSVRSLHAKAKKHAATMKGAMVLKGGSFMCHKSYCFRYRIAARSGSTPDSTTSHIGFRVAYDSVD